MWQAFVKPLQIWGARHWPRVTEILSGGNHWFATKNMFIVVDSIIQYFTLVIIRSKINGWDTPSILTLGTHTLSLSCANRPHGVLPSQCHPSLPLDPVRRWPPTPCRLSPPLDWARRHVRRASLMPCSPPRRSLPPWRASPWLRAAVDPTRRGASAPPRPRPVADPARRGASASLPPAGPAPLKFFIVNILIIIIYLIYYIIHNLTKKNKK